MTDETLPDFVKTSLMVCPLCWDTDAPVGACMSIPLAEPDVGFQLFQVFERLAAREKGALEGLLLRSDDDLLHGGGGDRALLDGLHDERSGVHELSRGDLVELVDAGEGGEARLAVDAGDGHFDPALHRAAGDEEVLHAPARDAVHRDAEGLFERGRCSRDADALSGREGRGRSEEGSDEE